MTLLHPSLALYWLVSMASADDCEAMHNLRERVTCLESKLGDLEAELDRMAEVVSEQQLRLDILSRRTQAAEAALTDVAATVDRSERNENPTGSQGALSASEARELITSLPAYHDPALCDVRFAAWGSEPSFVAPNDEQRECVGALQKSGIAKVGRCQSGYWRDDQCLHAEIIAIEPAFFYGTILYFECGGETTLTSIDWIQTSPENRTATVQYQTDATADTALLARLSACWVGTEALGPQTLQRTAVLDDDGKWRLK